MMYAYNCEFNTAENMGYFYDGCYVEKGDNLLEAERGYYNTKTHDLIAVDNVEMRDDTYLMMGDSVIFNTETENARYFTNTNIWNDKDEYLFANEGSYTKRLDLHHLTRDAYILSPEREIWSDTIEYYRTDGHIIGRRNIQMDDTTQKVLGFADYGEWWDEPGNALFTRRPSMINYDPQQPDSLFLSADTLWLYTIPVLPPVRETEDAANADGETQSEEIDNEASDSNVEASDESNEEMPMNGESIEDLNEEALSGADNGVEAAATAKTKDVAAAGDAKQLDKGKDKGNAARGTEAANGSNLKGGNEAAKRESAEATPEQNPREGGDVAAVVGSEVAMADNLNVAAEEVVLEADSTLVDTTLV